jgi:deoxyribodipyrimidine photo-lyase
VNALFPPGERTTSVHSFCEELVVRKELSDNFCFYNENYSTITGAHNWAQTTLQEHWNDPREVIYSEEQLERGLTHDQLWNAAQLEMVTDSHHPLSHPSSLFCQVNTGKMHGFMRMYWAKKVQTVPLI